jgi:ribosomal protein S18 acetylase RimI-like enzyme
LAKLVNNSLDILPPQYRWKIGRVSDRVSLLDFMCLTYQELFPQSLHLEHLRQTVDAYLSEDTPLWWIEFEGECWQKVACLWMGNALDQINGERYAYIFLIYVSPQHRCKGIGKALIATAKNWAVGRGDKQIGLQVFVDNQLAVNLYRHLGFKTQSLLMVSEL